MTQAQFKGAGKYAAGIIEQSGNSTDFSFDKEKSKVQIKPSKKGGDGGFTIQLNAKFIDCPAVGNDGGPGTCGVKDFPVIGHVMELNITVLGIIPAKVPLLYDIEKGKTKFQSSGKNKALAGVAGPIVSVLFKTTVAVDSIRLHVPGSDPGNVATGCDVLPLPVGDTCTDGAVYAVAGFRAGEDPDLTCATTAECDSSGANPTLICSGGGLCAPEPCTADVDCDQDGGGSGGSGQCDCTTSTCCDEATQPGCSAIC